MEKIVSRSNDKIKYASRLGSDSAFRREENRFLLEGARLCSDAVQSGIRPVRTFLTQAALKKYESYALAVTAASGEIYEIEEDVAKKLSDTDSPQGIFCVCEKKQSGGGLDCSGRYIALENVQDPSNIGAICRTVEALGLSGLIVSGGCDIYNPKALRAAMGSSLRLDITETDNLPAFLREAGEKGMTTLAAVPRADAADIRKTAINVGAICCIGNEGNGLTEETADACALRVTIPMKGRAESLNASAAAAVLAWELVK